MAGYDLRCRSCGKDFEVFVLGFLKDEAKVCPDCGSREVVQRFTGFGGFTRLNSGASCTETGRCEPNSCCSACSGFSWAH
jgi:putative FmdB family regulatory protein